MSTKYVEAGELKEGSYVVIDGEPCRVVEIEKSKTGKHGSAKARIVAVGVFDGGKRTLSLPVDKSKCQLLRNSRRKYSPFQEM